MAEKMVVGPHVFLPEPKLDCPNPFPQPCIVCAVYNDGKANVVAFGETGEMRTYENVVLVDAKGDVPAHYQCEEEIPLDMNGNPPGDPTGEGK